MLSNLGILHADIKPNNIMLVNRWEQPLQIKLIDFGLAIPKSCTSLGMQLQPTGFRYLRSRSACRLKCLFLTQIFSLLAAFRQTDQLSFGLLRAPEVSLGLPITEAVDLWGVGCTLAYLFLGEHLFSTVSMFQMVRRKTSDNTRI